MTRRLCIRTSIRRAGPFLISNQGNKPGSRRGSRPSIKNGDSAWSATNQSAKSLPTSCFHQGGDGKRTVQVYLYRRTNCRGYKLQMRSSR